MANRNGMGPNEEGPLTGRCLGPCNENNLRGRPCGRTKRRGSRIQLNQSSRRQRGN